MYKESYRHTNTHTCERSDYIILIFQLFCLTNANLDRRCGELLAAAEPGV